MLDKKLLGEKLRLARLKKNLSQYDLEKLADVDQRLISRYENGLCFPKLDIFLKIINALNVDINYILDKPNNMSDSSLKLIQEISYLTPKQITFVENLISEIVKCELK